MPAMRARLVLTALLAVGACGQPATRVRIEPPASRVSVTRSYGWTEDDAPQAVERPPVTIVSRSYHRPVTAKRPAPDGNVWACIRRLESGGDYTDKRNRSHFGAYQFALSTWASVGGVGNPADASPAEQDMRALMLQARSGWGQWSTHSRCGV